MRRMTLDLPERRVFFGFHGGLYIPGGRDLFFLIPRFLFEYQP